LPGPSADYWGIVGWAGRDIGEGVGDSRHGAFVELHDQGLFVAEDEHDDLKLTEAGDSRVS
jgi:hypothetical protein